MSYRVLTIGELGSATGRGRGRGLGSATGRGRGRGLGDLPSGTYAARRGEAYNRGYQDGVSGQAAQEWRWLDVGASDVQNQGLRSSYETGFSKGRTEAKNKADPRYKKVSAREGDGPGVPGVDVPPPGGGKGKAPAKGGKKAEGGGAALVLCTVDTGKGGWRKVNGRWFYAHHKDLILSSLASRFLGDGGMWKQIYNGSKERGLLPSGSTPDNVWIINPSTGERVTFWMPDAAILKAFADGCIPDKGDLGPGGKAGGKGGLIVGGLLAALLVGAVMMGEG
ncbi:MAG: hypothetical protein BWX86_02014 [Verrucomicrobia bacterium ADurb.Bin122]|nr:MAG: hypothetical protein BWX86_02014 [Verrucomicrobia bacterium ADurb.Bin122]